MESCPNAKYSYKDEKMQILKTAITAFITMASFAAASNASTVSLVSQSPSGINARISDLVNNSGLGYITADNFRLGSAATLTQVGWYGSYAAPYTEPVSDNFTIAFYTADSLGKPDNDTALVFNVGNTVNRVDTGVDVSYSGLNRYAYTANIAGPVLAANTSYWISIFADTTSGSEWRWERSAQGQGDNVEAYCNGTTNAICGTGWIGNSADLAFSLKGTAVPIPAAAWLFGSALLGLAGIKRSK